MKEPTDLVLPGTEVWCDVGGTFTDCFVQLPDGERRRAKFLSHGHVPGRIQSWVDDRTLCDPARCSDPDSFWAGAAIVVRDSRGNILDRVVCQAFCAKEGTLSLDRTPEGRSDAIAYEIDPMIEAPVVAARWLLQVPLAHPMPPVSLRLGTTRGTNALLTRTGARTAFVTTRGFADLLEIAYQERPDLFSLCIRKRQPLYERVIEIDERLDAHGKVLIPLDESRAFAALSELRSQGIESIAVCLLHSYRNSAHEQRVAALAQRAGFHCVCLSAEVAPVIRAVARGETTTVDAYLTPIVRAYLQRVHQQFASAPGGTFKVMTSRGGLSDAERVHGRETVLSGPAGGAVALEAIAHERGIPKLIGLDMGGTSTDVCRIDGAVQLDHETIKAGVRMMIPTLAIHTVASGGGSVCWFDGVQLRVGPQSAGSQPGPACYGRGGPLALTDLNLLAGRIDPERFPIPLDREPAQRRLNDLLAEVKCTPWFQSMDAGTLIAGLRRIANEQMAAAVRAITVQQGADPREHVLVGFGGAAGQHICEIAEILGIEQVLDHPDAGLLSALGIGLAQIKKSKSLPWYRPWNAITRDELRQAARALEQKVTAELSDDGVPKSKIAFRSEVALRYQGSEGTLRITWDDDQHEQLLSIFESEHQRRFGYARPVHPVELVELWMEGSSEPRNLQSGIASAHSLSEPHTTQGNIAGPVLVQRPGSTTVIDAGWTATMRNDGTLDLRRDAQKPGNLDAGQPTDEVPSSHEQVDPVLREVLAQRVAAIADQMGIVLEQTSISVNVKQRRDFSCAVFNAKGDLIANAPHVPVHLGAMSETVKAMMRQFPKMRPGDSFVTNDPYCGGSHLPDITVVTPVFATSAHLFVQAEEEKERGPDFFVASRAHHAEIGGIAPGSMSPTSTRLGDEGVLIPPMYLQKEGESCLSEIEEHLRGGRYPSRSVPENLADLSAQLAANERGVAAMRQLSDSLGLERVQRYLESVLEVAETKTRNWIATLEDREFSFSDCMDDGTPIVVTLRKRASHDTLMLEIDFEGTGAESAGNLNANPGIVTAAIMYCVRCAIADTMPLNAGVLRAVALKIPPGILNPRCVGPREAWPAVAGGNVETSQRIVDCLLGALGIAAASQGTMNNFLFGNNRFGYYETLGGGSGGCIDGPGADAVHSHMTNTRLTDVEVLELKYPVRLVEFAVRQGSGGYGRFSGGNGMIREVEALEALDVSLVTSRRAPYQPFGIFGGTPGKSGCNWLIRKSGERSALPASCQQSIEAGDRIRIETPGGGGYGISENPP